MTSLSTRMTIRALILICCHVVVLLYLYLYSIHKMLHECQSVKTSPRLTVMYIPIDRNLIGMRMSVDT